MYALERPEPDLPIDLSVLERQYDADLRRDIDQNPVNIPPAPEDDFDQHADDKIESRIATGILASVVVAGGIRAIIKHRRKET